MQQELFSLNTEKYIIKVMYNRPKTIVELSQKLKPNDFFNPSFRYLFTAIKKLSVKGDIDAQGIITLLENENKQGYDCLMNAGGVGAIDSLKDDSLPSSPSLDSHVDILKSFTYRRNAVVVAGKIKQYAELNYDPDDNKQFEDIEQLDSKVKEIVNSLAMNLKVQQSDKPVGDKIDDILNSIKNKDESMLGIDLSMKFPKFNTMIKRLQNGRVVCIISDAKAGKSTFLLEVSWQVVMQGRPVLFLDTELTEQEFIIRLMSKISGFTQDYIREGRFIGNEKEEEVIERVRKIIKEAPLYWQNVNYLSNSEIESTVKLFQLKYGIEFVAYDYLKTEETEGRIDKALGAKVNLAKEKIAKNCNVCVLTAVQMNVRTKKASDSYDIYRISDAIINWIKLPLDEQYLGDVKVTLEMCRYGAYNDPIYFTFDGAKQRIEEC